VTTSGVTTGSRDKGATRQRLLEAVGTLLSRDGFGALGVNAVAREASVDKVLIYRYYGGMADLLRAYGESGDFWPSIEEVIGHDPSVLMELSLSERWSLGLSRYARALRQRPVTQEILAWEQVEQNELTQILQQARERWFEELMSHFPSDADSTDADLVSTILLIVSAIHYLVVRSRLQPDFSGLAIGTDEGWGHIDTVIATMFDRTFKPRAGATPVA
jgi:AcrR family transcriptional regulator